MSFSKVSAKGEAGNKRKVRFPQASHSPPRGEFVIRLSDSPRMLREPATSRNVGHWRGDVINVRAFAYAY